MLRRVDTPDPVVFVTIDDGWDKDPRVIPFLVEKRWPISAFLITHVARHNPGYWRQLVAAGDLVEDHTTTHPALAHRSLAAQTAQICPAADDDVGLFGRRPTLFRPPYGSMDAVTIQAAANCGLHFVVLWDVTIDRQHFARATPGPLQRGDIVLLHWGPALFNDLQVLDQQMASADLHPGRLEDYLP